MPCAPLFHRFPVRNARQRRGLLAGTAGHAIRGPGAETLAAGRKPGEAQLEEEIIVET